MWTEYGSQHCRQRVADRWELPFLALLSLYYYLWVHDWENGLCYPAWHCQLEKARSQWGSFLLKIGSEKMGSVCTVWTQNFQVTFSFSFLLNCYLILNQSVTSQYTDFRWTVVWEHIQDESRLPWEERWWSPSSVPQLRMSHFNCLCKEWTVWDGKRMIID